MGLFDFFKKKKTYPLYAAKGGCCYSCGQSIGGQTVYDVPYDDFYDSILWRGWYKHHMFMQTNKRISDEDIENLRIRDRQPSVLVCSTCIYMFK